MTETVAREWLAGLSEVLEQRDLDAIRRSLPARRLVARPARADLGPAHPARHGPDPGHARGASGRRVASGFTLTEGKPVALVEPAEDVRWIEAFFDFETAVGRGRGVVRRMPTVEGWRAWTLLTALQELKGDEEHAGPRRPWGVEHGEQAGREIWLDRRSPRAVLRGPAEPRVLVVGARPGRGSPWRRACASSASTRSSSSSNRARRRQLAQALPQPRRCTTRSGTTICRTWRSRRRGRCSRRRTSSPSWFESYAAAMELDVWTETELVGGGLRRRGRDAGTARVERRPDGEGPAARPAHVVLATGASGEPRVPEIPGTEDFRGTVSHSTAIPAARRSPAGGPSSSATVQQRARHRPRLPRAGRRRDDGAALVSTVRDEQRARHPGRVRRALRGGRAADRGRRPGRGAPVPTAGGELNKQTTQAIARARPRAARGPRGRPGSPSTSARTAAAC